MIKLTKEEMKKVMGGNEPPISCDNIACARKSSDTVGLCGCTDGGQCVCVS